MLTRPAEACDTPSVDTAELIVGPEAIDAARERIASRVNRTPQLRSTTAASLLAANGGPRLAGDVLHVKAEHLQKTGSFKARGLTNRILTLDEADRTRGVITVSAGNAAQAYAWAGLAAGVPVTVIMPAGGRALEARRLPRLRGRGDPPRQSRRRHVRGTGTDLRRTWPDASSIRSTTRRSSPATGRSGSRSWRTCPTWTSSSSRSAAGDSSRGVAAAIKEHRPAARVYGVEPESQRDAACARGGRAGPDRAEDRRRRPDRPVRRPVDARDVPPLPRWTSSSSTTRRSSAACGLRSSG